MSNLSAALAASLQNDSTISALISGVIAGRNFDLQDNLLATDPTACIVVADLISHEAPYINTPGSGDVISDGQIEIRCISKSSETAAKDLAAAVKTLLWASRTLPWNGSTIAFPITGLMQNSLISEDLTIWEEILTVDYES